EYRHHLKLLRRCIEWYDRFGTPSDEDDLREEIAKLVGKLKAALESENDLMHPNSLLPDGVGPSEKAFIFSVCSEGIVGLGDHRGDFDHRYGTLGWTINDIWRERHRQLDELGNSQRKQPQTVQYQVQRFLDFKERQANAG